MWQEGFVNAFTPFDNEKCENGFLYFRHSTKTLTVATLQPFLKYEADWPFKKIKLNYTPCFSSYDLEQKVLTVCGSRSEKIEMLPKVSFLPRNRRFWITRQILDKCRRPQRIWRSSRSHKCWNAAFSSGKVRKWSSEKNKGIPPLFLKIEAHFLNIF